MNVAIVGSGIAGKTCALYLRRLPFISNIHIVEEMHTKESNLTTGLWGPALACFPELGLHEILKPHLQQVGPSGYKGVGGEWLARPMAEPPLAFIRNTVLLTTLDDQFQRPSRPGTATVNIVRGRVKGLTMSQSGDGTVTLHTSSPADQPEQQHHVDAHLVIAADGLFSTLRGLFLRAHHTTTSVSSVHYRGYRVYRGHAAASHGQRVASEAFQVRHYYLPTHMDIPPSLSSMCRLNIPGTSLNHTCPPFVCLITSVRHGARGPGSPACQRSMVTPGSPLSLAHRILPPLVLAEWRWQGRSPTARIAWVRATSRCSGAASGTGTAPFPPSSIAPTGKTRSRATHWRTTSAAAGATPPCAAPRICPIPPAPSATWRLWATPRTASTRS